MPANSEFGAVKTVITFGTYDLFHIGHLRILERARALGTRLVVGVSTDELNMAKKGFYPIFKGSDRFAIVASLRVADAVFFEESMEKKADYIEEYNAHVLVMGDDWAGRFDHFRDRCEVVYLPRTTGISTTAIKQDVVERTLK